MKFELSKLRRAPKTLTNMFLTKISPIFCDEVYLKILFRFKVGYILKLDRPRTYNEKLQWLKLNYRRSIMTGMVDKYEAKKIISDVVGEEYIVHNYGIWNSFKEINFDKLPNQFVLKTTHDQGGVVICRNKSQFDYIKAEKILNKHLNRKHYYLSREWPYKNVTPRILAEKLLITNEDIIDYKFYCFHGVPKVMYISTGRQTGNTTFDFYDMEFNHLNLKRPHHNNSKFSHKKPQNWDLMIELSSKLSKGFPHLRVDFYEIEQKLYVGELTFFQGGGLMPFIPQEWDYKLGSWIDINSYV